MISLCNLSASRNANAAHLVGEDFCCAASKMPDSEMHLEAMVNICLVPYISQVSLFSYLITVAERPQLISWAALHPAR
jgi:hypothetical protein